MSRAAETMILDKNFKPLDECNNLRNISLLRSLRASEMNEFVRCLHSFEVQGRLSATQALVLVWMQRSDPLLLLSATVNTLPRQMLLELVAIVSSWTALSPSAPALEKLAQMYEAKLLASYEAYRLQFLVLQQQPEVLTAVLTSNVTLLKAICASCSRQLRLPTIPSVVEADNVLQELYGPAASLYNPETNFDISHEQVLEAAGPLIERLAAQVPAPSPACIQHLLALANGSNDRLRDIVRLFKSGHVPESQLLRALLVLGTERNVQTPRSTLLCVFHTLSLPQQALEMLELELDKESPLLFAAYDLYSEQLYSRSAYIELIDTIVRLIRRRCPEDGKVLPLIDESCLAAIKRAVEGLEGMNMADVACLWSEFESGNTALHAAFSLFCEDGDNEELIDTLKRFSQRWRIRADERLSLQLAKVQGLGVIDTELLDLSIMNGWIALSDIIEAAETRGGIRHIVSASYLTLVKHQIPKLHNLVVSLQRSLELSRPDTAFLLQMIDDEQQSEVAHAAFHLYEKDGNRRELIDTLSRLGRKWRWNTKLAPFARIIGELRRDGLINNNQVEILELDLVEGHLNVAEVLLNDRLEIPSMLRCAFEHDQFRWKMFLHELLACETAPVHFGATGLHFLQHIVDDFDVSVMATISLFEESQDSDELMDTLWHISRRWRAPTSTRGATLSLIGSLSLPVEGALETLELAIYNEDATVMGAVALYREGESSRADLVDTLSHVLRRKMGDDSLTELALARVAIDALGATSCITLVGHRYLHSLLHSSPISGRRDFVQTDEHARVVLQAALSLYNESGSAEEFLDSFKRVASISSKGQPSRDNSRWKGDRLDIADMIAFETGSLREEISAVDVDEEMERRRLARVKGIAYRARLLQRAGFVQDADYNALLRLVDTTPVKRAWDRFKRFKVDPTSVLVSEASRWRKRPDVERLLATLEHLRASGLVYGSSIRVVEVLLERGEGTELCELLARKEALLAAVQELVDREQHRSVARMQEALNIVLEEETMSGPSEAYLVELVQQQNPVFTAAVVEFEESGSAEELCDTLLRLSQSWKRHPNAATLLELCSQLVEAQWLPQHLLSSLEMMVYHRNARCWQALSRLLSLQQPENDLQMSDLVSVLCALASEASERPRLLSGLHDFVALYDIPSAGEQRLRRLLEVDDERALDALQRNDAATMLQLSYPDWPRGSVWAEVNSLIEELGAANGPLSELEQTALLQLAAGADEVVLSAFVTYSTMLVEGSGPFLAVAELVDSLKRIARRRALGADERPLQTELDSLGLPQQQLQPELSLTAVDHSIVLDAAWYELVETGDYEEFYDTLARAEKKRHPTNDDDPGQDAPFFAKSALEDFDDMVKTDEIIA